MHGVRCQVDHNIHTAMAVQLVLHKLNSEQGMYKPEMLLSLMAAAESAQTLLAFPMLQGTYGVNMGVMY